MTKLTRKERLGAEHFVDVGCFGCFVVLFVLASLGIILLAARFWRALL